jgi:serine protease Do
MFKKHYLKIVCFCILAVLLFLVFNFNKGFTQPIKPQESALSLQKSFSEIAQELKPSVVSITTHMLIKKEIPYSQFFFGDPFESFFDDFFNRGPQRRRVEPRQRYSEKRLEGGGSGVVIDEKGYVLTNFHVIENAEKIRVHFATDGNKTYDAEIVGQDPYTDLAVLKIKSNKKFKPAVTGNSDDLKVGDWVIAVGSPFGLEQTVTAGIVSAKRQAMQVEGRRYEDFIQTDAAINRGNSCGPLVNIRGEIIGINTAIYAPTGVFSGVGFAIPINKAKDILDELIKEGKVVRGWLGVEIKEVDEAIAKQFGLKEKYGALVNKVVEDSPADKGGIKRGDIIIKVNSEKVKDISHLQKLVKSMDPGKIARLTLFRDGRQKEVKIKIGTMPDDITIVSGQGGHEDKGNEWKGYTVSNLTRDLAERYGIPKNEDGVVVTKVDFNNEYVDIGLAEGDIIKGINRKNISSISDFRRAVKKADLSEGVVFDVLRQGRPVYITYQSK